MAKTIKFQLMLHGDLLEAFIDERVSICSRLHLRGTSLGIIAREAPITLTNIKLSHLAGNK